jgi:glycosyltransferase involved in cell wall biosynthesis
VRLLFVSSTTIGGSGRSQRELAARLWRMGHDVSFVVDDGSSARVRRWLYEQLSDLAAKVGTRPGQRVVQMVERVPGRRSNRAELDGLLHRTTPVPENAIASVLDSCKPDALIGNSLVRLSWLRIRRACEQRGVPTILYIREVESLDHLVPGQIPDVILANAESLVAEVRRRGFECSFVPSVVDLDAVRTTPSRRVALVINPIDSRGVDIVGKLAGTLPEIPFVLQESWPLGPGELGAAQEMARLPNVELRRRTPSGPDLYRDARVLLVPYRVDNRPRVIPEAQANGIPVIVGDVPALVEAVGAGGLRVPLEDVDGWRDSLRRLWHDEELYRELSEGALRNSQRRELDPDVIARSFLDVVERVVGKRLR